MSMFFLGERQFMSSLWYTRKMISLLSTLAIIGNVLFILWMTFNGIDERGQGATPAMIMSYIGLTLLLILNSVLLFRQRKK